MSVPHILADESSAYYHAYVLAEMSVHQTRAHFKRKYGALTDNQQVKCSLALSIAPCDSLFIIAYQVFRFGAVQVGKDLEEVYWRPGNGAAFLDLVHQLTGQPLSADAWVQQLQQPIAALLQEEEQDYQEAVQAGPKLKPGRRAHSTSVCSEGSELAS